MIGGFRGENTKGQENPNRPERLLLELGVPVEIVHPAFVQIVGREQPAVLVQVVHGRLVGLVAGHMRAAAGSMSAFLRLHASRRRRHSPRW